MKVYRGTDGDNAPVECTCEVFGYPNYCTAPDGDREKMYENTHFRTPGEAWESIMASARAGVRISGRMVTDAKERLQQMQEMAANDAERFAIVTTGYDDCQRAAKGTADGQ